MTVWDPLRRKDVASTPEETVRQWFISELRQTFGVPVHMMMSEVSMTLGSKPYRADIVIYGRDAAPLAVVECKRCGIPLSGEVLEQALRYNNVLDVKYIIVTNGAGTYAYRRNGDCFVSISRIPSYEEMICQR